MLRRILMMMVLALGVGTVANAKQLNVDLAKAVCSENANLSEGLFEWTASQAYIEFTEVSGDLSACTELVVEALELTGAPFQIELVLEDGTVLKGSGNGYWSPSTKNIVLSDFGVSLNAVQSLRIVGESEAGTLKLGNIYLIEPLRLNFDETGKAYLYPEDLIDCTIGVTMSEDGTITKTGTGNASLTLDFGDIDLSGITNIVADVEYTEDIMWRTLVINTDDQSITNENGGSGFYSAKYNISYSDFNRSQSGHISKVQYEFAAEKEGQIKFKSICFTSGFITAVKGDEVCLNDLPFNVKQADGSFQAQVNPTWNVNVATDLVYGYGTGVEKCEGYADLGEYKEIRVYSSSSTEKLRFFFFNSTATDKETFYPTSVEGKDYRVINIADVKAQCGGQAKLIGVKWDNDATYYPVSNIAVVKSSAIADYNISGYGIVDASVNEVLADANATRIDVTGLANANPMPLTSANPNCLFIASDAAKLANTTNVLVADEEGGYECADLSLDAAYPFKAPFDFVATTATVKKSVTEIGFATFVSPYSVAVPDGCEAYKIVSVDDADVLQCEPVEQIIANEPVLLVGEGAHQFAANSVAVSANTGTLVSGLLNGSYEATTAPASSYVLQNQSGVTAFYRVAEAGKQQVVPFTAYLTLPAAGANVRMLSIDLGSDATAIENVPSSAATVVAVYDLSGRSVEGLQRGINLVKMSDGTVKKIIVK